MSPDPLNARTTAELELVDSERFHIDGRVLTARTTTRMMTEVVIEGNDTYNPGQIREMADEVKNLYKFAGYYNNKCSSSR